jgi:hypothetical protein
MKFVDRPLVRLRKAVLNARRRREGVVAPSWLGTTSTGFAALAVLDV